MQDGPGDAWVFLRITRKIHRYGEGYCRWSRWGRGRSYLIQCTLACSVMKCLVATIVAWLHFWPHGDCSGFLWRYGVSCSFCCYEERLSSFSLTVYIIKNWLQSRQFLFSFCPVLGLNCLYKRKWRCHERLQAFLLHTLMFLQVHLYF